jgi:hypothetical protein
MAASNTYAKGYAQGYGQAQAPLGARVQGETPQLPKCVPSPAPFAFFPTFIAQKPETLVIKSKSAWTDSSYNISTIDGRPIFNVK